MLIDEKEKIIVTVINTSRAMLMDDLVSFKGIPPIQKPV